MERVLLVFPLPEVRGFAGHWPWQEKHIEVIMAANLAAALEITAGNAEDPLRILQVVQKAQRRGAEVFATQLTHALRGEGHQLRTIFIYDHDGPNGVPIGTDDVVLGGRESHPSERLPGINPRILRRLLTEIDRFQPDVIQLNGARAVKYGAAARRIQSSAGWKFVYRNIGNPGDWDQGILKRLVVGRMMSAMDGVVGLSNQALRELVALYGEFPAHTVIPNGVDASLAVAERPASSVREELTTPEEAVVFIAVGSLSREKRFDLLLDAFARLTSDHPSAFLWIVGDGPLKETLTAQAAALGLAAVARFLGVRTDVPTLLAAADVFVLTSDTEGIPAVVLEAGLQALPVVATRVGGIPECVIEGETGLLVARGDVDEISEAMRVLLSDPQLRKTMGQRGLELVRKRFTMETIARQYVAFYRSMVGQRTGTGRRER